MEPIYRTGNETVDRLSRIQITGNVIPAAWYRTIRKETGKPYLNAIVILSDIVYWYRAAEIRDEGSGQLLGYRKRFKADLLQRSYQQMADQFGISKRDATNAVVALEKLGVIRRVFRTLELNGQTVPNVLFIRLDVEALEQLTYPEEFERDGVINGSEKEAKPLVEEEKEESIRNQKGNFLELETCKSSNGYKQGYPLFERDVSQKGERGVPEIRVTTLLDKRDAPTEMRETNTKITYRDYSKDDPILSYQEVKENFKCQVEYDILAQDGWDQEELNELIEIAVEILLSKAETIRVNREEKPAELVKRQYGKLTMMHMQYVLRSLQKTETKARNIRAVLVTALYNAVNTIGNYHRNLYQHYNGMG